MKKLITLSVLMALGSNSYAAGPLLNELGTLSASTAGAGAAALGESAVTAWSNPAAMSELDGMQFSGNLALLSTKIDYKDKGSTGVFSEGKNGDAGGNTPIASAYFTAPINDQFTFGLALASQGGSGVDYGKESHGQRLLEMVEFASVQLAPSLSYKVNDNLSLGVSINFEYATAIGELDPLSKVTPGYLEADADDTEFGYSLSAFYKFNEHHRIGFIYRSEIDHYLEGDVKQTNGSNKQDVGLQLIMPAQASVSGVHSVHADWEMLWSITWFDTSSWTDLTLDINDTSAKIIDRNFDDAWAYSIGAHYQINNKWRFETGVSFETSVQDDPEHQYLDLPAGDIWRWGVGATYQLNDKWQVSPYYEFIDLGEPDINYQNNALPNSELNGQYNNSAHYFGVQVNYKF